MTQNWLNQIHQNIHKVSYSLSRSLFGDSERQEISTLPSTPLPCFFLTPLKKQTNKQHFSSFLTVHFANMLIDTHKVQRHVNQGNGVNIFFLPTLPAHIYSHSKEAVSSVSLHSLSSLSSLNSGVLHFSQRFLEKWVINNSTYQLILFFLIYFA